MEAHDCKGHSRNIAGVSVWNVLRISYFLYKDNDETNI